MVEPNVNKSFDKQSNGFAGALYIFVHFVVVFSETATRSDDKLLYFM